MSDFLFRTLWRYDPTATDAVIYSWFNVAEAVAWFAIAGYVLGRFAKYRRTGLEVVYGVTFILFGISDLWESYIVQPWLIGVKGLIFIGLVAMRMRLVRRHYVGWKF